MGARLCRRLWRATHGQRFYDVLTLEAEHALTYPGLPPGLASVTPGAVGATPSSTQVLRWPRCVQPSCWWLSVSPGSSQSKCFKLKTFLESRWHSTSCSLRLVHLKKKKKTSWGVSGLQAAVGLTFWLKGEATLSCESLGTAGLERDLWPYQVGESLGEVWPWVKPPGKGSQHCSDGGWQLIADPIFENSNCLPTCQTSGQMKIQFLLSETLYEAKNHEETVRNHR